MRSVTENVSALVGADVVCNACWNGDRYGSTFRWGNEHLHCSTCHGGDHWACAECGKCLPRGARLDRAYCSSTCRGRARKRRERDALERAAREAENPEAAAQEQAAHEARLEEFRALGKKISGGVSPADRADRERTKDLKARAEGCAKTIVHTRRDDQGGFIPPAYCASFGAGDVIYRRRRYPSDITSDVLPYCAEHRCPQSDGHHNRDAPEGRYYPGCCCDDRHWTDPEPCLGCGRLVSHPKHAAWRALADWVHYQQPDLAPRVFCGGDCKRRVLAVEAKSCRLTAAAERGPVRCATCAGEFTPARHDARYCSSACRQKAYRERRSS